MRSVRLGQATHILSLLRLGRSAAEPRPCAEVSLRLGRSAAEPRAPALVPGPVSIPGYQRKGSTMSPMATSSCHDKSSSSGLPSFHGKPQCHEMPSCFGFGSR